MKRNEKKVPEFDEIIFENRNKAYGAYDIRKRYNSVTSLSIMGGIAFATMLITSISFTTEKGTASTGPRTVVLVMADPIIPEKINAPELKPPPEAPKTITNVEPVVTTDTTEITPDIPITDVIISTTKNGDVNDTVTFIDNTTPEIPAETKPFIYVEEMPEFPGGIPALMKYIGENMKYPAEAQSINLQGKVNLKFVVNADGSVDRIEILRGIDPLLDNEAVRVIQTLPKFKPGRQGGIAVPVWFSIPVVFKLLEN